MNIWNIMEVLCLVHFEYMTYWRYMLEFQRKVKHTFTTYWYLRKVDIRKKNFRTGKSPILLLYLYMKVLNILNFYQYCFCIKFFQAMFDTGLEISGR